MFEKWYFNNITIIYAVINHCSYWLLYWSISKVFIVTHKSLPYTYEFSRDVNFLVFVVNWLLLKFSSSKFYWRNLHRLESRTHLNGDIWHLQEMMESFCLSSCHHQGNLKTEWSPDYSSPNSTFQSILYALNSGFWEQFRYIKPEIRGHVIKHKTSWSRSWQK